MSHSIPTIIYKDIPDAPGYRVGSDGSVWSRWKLVHLGGKSGSKAVLGTAWKRLKTTGLTKGVRYLVVGIRRNGVWRQVAIHHLVLEAFVSKRPKGAVGCHNDGDTTNNRVSNLRWDSQIGNMSDRVSHGTVPHGSRNGRSKLSEDIVRCIRTEYASGKVTMEELAVKYGVNGPCIHHVISRRTWSHVN